MLLTVSNRLSAVNDTTVIAAAVLIFAGFKNLDIGSSRFINTVSASTLGIYLLHTNGFFVHDLMVTILHTPDYLYSPRLYVHAPLAIAGMFAVLAVVDLIFRKLILDPLMRQIENHWDGWCSRMRTIFSKAEEKA